LKIFSNFSLRESSIAPQTKKAIEALTPDLRSPRKF
jgi:hypothetical protein